MPNRFRRRLSSCLVLRSASDFASGPATRVPHGPGPAVPRTPRPPQFACLACLFIGVSFPTHTRACAYKHLPSCLLRPATHGLRLDAPIGAKHLGRLVRRLVQKHVGGRVPSNRQAELALRCRDVRREEASLLQSGGLVPAELVMHGV